MPSEQSRNPSQIYSAIWTHMHNKVPICASLDGEFYGTAYML